MSTPVPTDIPPYVEHIGITRQYWRDIILGVNDGLVSMLLLVAGVVGGGLDADQVLLTGVAGAIAGAVSMAAGEYLATKSQDEVLTAELDLERTHILHYRDQEVEQVRDMLTTMGVAAADLDLVATALTRDDETLLNAMAALEFGVVDSERRSPYKAMVMSGLLFLGGALSSVVP
ncbi:MAG TPA: VIT1/CCC1 transporter family protein, partial [Acidimicrobiia bacterium]|nr:VIT1/CCC1 transporter family protein [Acidimicrobiia bacterium]